MRFKRKTIEPKPPVEYPYRWGNCLCPSCGNTFGWEVWSEDEYGPQPCPICGFKAKDHRRTEGAAQDGGDRPAHSMSGAVAPAPSDRPEASDSDGIQEVLAEMRGTASAPTFMLQRWVRMLAPKPDAEEET